MWALLESDHVLKAVKKVQPEILEKYEYWKNVVRTSGPDGLRALKGFRDEALAGEWKGYRSSRLNIQFRVIYRVAGAEVSVYVVELTPHDYRR